MAFQFTPPTYDQARKTPKMTQRQRRLWRFYDGHAAGYSVLITDGVASTYPGVVAPEQDSIDAATSYFQGGHTYTVTAAEKTILEAASYTVDTV